ncbi:diguanylate cyclase [bacterium]|nr:diguanylate cyclase [bacterium]
MSARAHKAAKPRGKRAPLERDRLTGLPAGGGARSRLESELAENVSRGEPVSLAIADIDELRDVNRVLGPDRADAVLRAVAKRIATSLPRGASAIRLAGDAFLALLPGTEPDQALIEMQAVRAAVSRSPVVAGRGAARREAYPTVSIGVAGAPRDGATFRELLASAQSAVRHAKTLGRDRVASPPDEKMVLKASYYSKTQLERLKSLAGGLGVNESVLLREALEDLLLKHKGLLS